MSSKSSYRFSNTFPLLLAILLISTCGDDGVSPQDCENFADKHWNAQKWIDHHPHVYDQTGFTIEDMDSIGHEKSGSWEWPGYIPWVSKIENKQRYYDNIGKYDWYISGWEDYDPAKDPPFMLDTPLRNEYRAMRK
jgi:hypothetical protein